MSVMIKMLKLIIGCFMSLALFVMNIVAKIYSHIASIFFIIIGICALLAFFSKQWIALGIFGIMFVAGMVIFWFIAEIMVFIEILKDKVSA